MFTVYSVVAKVWAEAVKKGDKVIEDVPNLSNLRDIVYKIIKGDE